MQSLSIAHRGHVLSRSIRTPDTRFWPARIQIATPSKCISSTDTRVRSLHSCLCTGALHTSPARGLTPRRRSPLRELSQPRVATGLDTKRGLVSATVTEVAADLDYDAVIVGAGPAGITVLGNLLEQDVGRVLWVDDKFTAGRVNHAYREVPSNTKTKLFIDFAEAVSPFREIIKDTPSPNPVDALRKLEQDKGCDLGKAADMLLMLTDGLVKHPRVQPMTGRVNAANLSDTDTWTVSVDRSGSSHPVTTSRLILCTGSSPTESPLPVKITNISALALDTALSPSVLAHKISKTERTTIAVIGASHSAILVVLNLSRLAQTTHRHLRVKWFTRHELRYAEFMDGWILRDNTGLKGEAAAWARENLEESVWASSKVRDVVQKIAYRKGDEMEVLKEHLQGCDYYVQAIGYTRDPLPGLTTQHGSGELRPAYNHSDGSFTYSEPSGGGQRKIAGLYGAGIAWPEQVTDPRGNVEYAVGFWKFMKFIKRVSPGWT